MADKFLLAHTVKQASIELKKSKGLPNTKCGCIRNVINYATNADPTKKLKMPTGKAA